VCKCSTYVNQFVGTIYIVVAARCGEFIMLLCVLQDNVKDTLFSSVFEFDNLFARPVVKRKKKTQTNKKET